MPISDAARLMASTAWPNETPRRRLNDSVTAGNRPWCVTDKGPTSLVRVTRTPSGTAAPVNGDLR